MPSAARLWISSQNSRRALGSTPAVGSSSSSSRGSGRMQAPSASRCFQPPDSSPASWSLRLASPSRAMARSCRRPGVRHAIDARHEFEILADRQVGIEAEALRHVADIALDLVLLGEDVVAEAGAFAGIRREQPAQHAERRGLAAAVRPEKAVDLALRHFEAQVAHHGARTEALGQTRDVDGDLFHRRTICSPGPSVTVTGWPAVSLAAAPSGRASTR